jgi:hypothetical protein
VHEFLRRMGNGNHRESSGRMIPILPSSFSVPTV